MIVTLEGGPFNGAEVEVNWGETLACQGQPLPEGTIARYRPSRRRSDGVYRFREYDRVIASIPWPPERAT